MTSRACLCGAAGRMRGSVRRTSRDSELTAMPGNPEAALLHCGRSGVHRPQKDGVP
ncbi:hypothetical protein ACFPRL_18340 [Pseudoclavibacter helvolus]